MAIIPFNVSVSDFTITKTGSLDNIVSIIESEGFSGITQDLSEVKVDSFYDDSNSYSRDLRSDKKKIVSLKDSLEIPKEGHSFDEGFDKSYNSPD